MRIINKERIMSTGIGDPLGHEMWHVVQQAQGRVPQTTHVMGKSINDCVALEREADHLGGLVINSEQVTGTVDQETGTARKIMGPLSKIPGLPPSVKAMDQGLKSAEKTFSKVHIAIHDVGLVVLPIITLAGTAAALLKLVNSNLLTPLESCLAEQEKILRELTAKYAGKSIPEEMQRELQKIVHALQALEKGLNEAHDKIKPITDNLKHLEILKQLDKPLKSFTAVISTMNTLLTKISQKLQPLEGPINKLNNDFNKVLGRVEKEVKKFLKAHKINLDPLSAANKKIDETITNIEEKLLSPIDKLKRQLVTELQKQLPVDKFRQQIDDAKKQLENRVESVVGQCSEITLRLKKL